MPRRRTLTKVQLESLLALPVTEADLVQHWTLGDDDLAIVGRRRRNHDRLGFALQLCALRYPGRLLRPGEIIPRPALHFVADQLGTAPEALITYAARFQTRYEQLAVLRTGFGFTDLTPRRRQILGWLLPVSLATTNPLSVATALLDELRRRRIIVPGPSIVERLIAATLAAAELHVANQLTGRLTPAQSEALEALLAPKPDTAMSVLAWARAWPVLHRLGPVFLDAFKLRTVPAAASTLRAVELLHDAYRSGGRAWPESLPVSFLRAAWRDAVLGATKAGGAERRIWEAATLLALRDRLRAGDIWVEGSRQWRAVEDQLIPPALFAAMRAAGPLPVAVPQTAAAYLAERRALLDRRLSDVAAKAAADTLEDVTIKGGDMKIMPLKAVTPEAAEDLANRLTAHWDDVLRLTASVRTGTVSASLMLKRLGAYPRQNGLALVARDRPHRTHALHFGLAGTSPTETASDGRAEQGRKPQRVGAGGVLPPPRSFARPYRRTAAAPRQRPDTRHRRHRAVEHRLSRPGPGRLATPRRDRAGCAARPHRPPRMAAHQSHRRLSPGRGRRHRPERIQTVAER